VQSYIQVHNLDVKNKVGCSEDVVSLKAMPVTGEDLSSELAERIDRKVSVDKDRLNDIMKKDAIFAEIEALHLTLTVDFEEGESDITPLKNAKKGKMLDKLIELRTKYFSLDQEAKEHYTELTTREFEEEHPGAVSMEDVIALDIYQLSDEVFGWERYSSAPEVAGFVERTGG